VHARGWLTPIAVAGLVLLSSSGPALAQQAKEKAAPAAPQAQGAPKGAVPGWTVRCNNPGQGLVCKAVQTVVLAKTRQLLISITVGKPADDGNAAMLLQLPLGLYNPAGVKVGIDDGAAETLAIQTCDAKGCYAGMAVTPEKQAAMIKGAKLNVVFQDLKKQSITVPVPLTGFDVAFKKL